MHLLFALSVYLLRILTIGTAIGVFCIRCSLFEKMGKPQKMAIGFSSAAFVVGLIDYLLGFVFVGWPSWFYFSFAFVLAVVYLIYGRNYQVAISAYIHMLSAMNKTRKDIGKWLILDAAVLLIIFTAFIAIWDIGKLRVLFWKMIEVLKIFDGNLWTGAICFGIAGLICACIFFYFFIKVIKKMTKEGVLLKNALFILLVTVIFCNCFLGLSQISLQNIGTDRSHYELNARYFQQDKNSFELDNYKDKHLGSSLRDDHGPLWSMYLADANIIADTVGIQDHYKVVNFAVFWVYLCFDLLIFIVSSHISGTWLAGLATWLLFGLYRYEGIMLEGSRDAFRFIGLLLLLMYSTDQFSRLSEDKSRWYHHIVMFFVCYFSINGHQGNSFIMLGMFFVMGVMLLIYKAPWKQLIPCAFSILGGTVLGLTKSISLYITTGELVSTTLLPFHGTPVVQQINEVRANRIDVATILQSYTMIDAYLIILGVISLFVMIWILREKRHSEPFIYAMLIAGMLLPLTSIMNLPGYETAKWFFEQVRYRMYFLMLFAITGGWLLTRKWEKKQLKKVAIIGITLTTVLFFRVELEKYVRYGRPHLNSWSRIAGSYQKLNENLMELTDGDVFTDHQPLLFYLGGEPKLLFHEYTEDLIQAKTDAEIESALTDLNVGAIILPPDGHDYHDYSLLPFWDYINTSDKVQRIPERERDDGESRTIFLINPK